MMILKNDTVQHFLTDLLERGHLCIESNFNGAETNRSGSHLLYPGSLPYFTKLIQEKQLVTEASEVNKTNRILYDLMLTLAFGYCQTNPQESIYLLKESKELLDKKL